MAELNEKLGTNMQALEDELFTELRTIACRVESSLAVPARSESNRGAIGDSNTDAMTPPRGHEPYPK